jgi:hypothetical protein
VSSCHREGPMRAKTAQAPAKAPRVGNRVLRDDPLRSP